MYPAASNGVYIPPQTSNGHAVGVGLTPKQPGSIPMLLGETASDINGLRDAVQELRTRLYSVLRPLPPGPNAAAGGAICTTPETVMEKLSWTNGSVRSIRADVVDLLERLEL